jgi:ABC-2 type transport system ATP-binding protein
MSIISVRHLSKMYPVAVKQPGLRGTLQHLVKRTYNPVTAVNDISFAIEPGEVVGFLGPNGAGKTTTLKMLTGLIHPSQGEIEVAGHRPYQRDRDFLQRITLVMGQKQQLIWDLPAMDSLRINAAVYGIGDHEFRRRVGELAEMLSLDAQLYQPVRKLSLGERMKAEVLAALVHRPAVLFLDEPTLGLDVNAQVSVRNFLRDYNQRYGATILLTSHYMADITALCQRVMLIHAGQLIYDGDLEHLIDRFAPYREVTVELDMGPEPPSEAAWRDRLERYGALERLEGCMARLIVRRDQLPTTIARLLAEEAVLDLTVADPPVEDVIGRVFQQGQVV